MKILIIGHAYIVEINRIKWKTIADKYHDTQIKVLIPNNWPTSLFNLNADKISDDNLKNCQFIALDSRKSGNEVLYSFNFFDLIKILKNFKPELIHVEQGDNAFSYFQIILLSKIFCRKAKFIFFTWVNWKHKWSLKYKLFWQFIEKFNLFFSDGAIVGNDHAKVILEDKKFKKPIEILLQLGVDQTIFLPKHNNNNNNRKIIGFVGRLVPEKGIFDLLEAFSKLVNKFNNWDLAFIGDGIAKDNLQERIKKLNLENYVFIKNAVSHKIIAQYLNGLDIFVLPSYDTPEWREQFGHVLIEAMACKIPVVGSTGGHIPKVVADSGLIFEQKNIKALEDVLQNLMSDENKRKFLAQKGYERFLNNYSYEYIANKTYGFWKKIMKN